MERLTNSDKEIPTLVDNAKYWLQVYFKLKDYEDLEEQGKVEEERRSKDPILFGVFQDNQSRTVIDRFYYLGDWVDEYCDLTLDKMVNESQKVGHRNITHTIKTPADIEELKSQLGQLHSVSDTHFTISSTNTNDTKKSFFGRIKTFLKK